MENRIEIMVMCAGCKQNKPVSHFHKNRCKKDGRMSSCAKCTIERRKHRYIRAIDYKLQYLPENLLNEEWRPVVVNGVVIPNYEISNCGRVKTFHKDKKGKIGKLFGDSLGYPMFCFSMNNKKITRRVHVLVGTAFVSNPENYPILNHLDGNPQNSHYTNLEWTTPKLNTKHAVEMGLITGMTAEEHPATRILLNVETGIYYYGHSEAASAINLKSGTLLARMQRNYKSVTTPFIYA